MLVKLLTACSLVQQIIGGRGVSGVSHVSYERLTMIPVVQSTLKVHAVSDTQPWNLSKAVIT